MSATEDVWRLTLRLADFWQRSQVVQDFRKELPQNNHVSGLSGISEQLQTLQASGMQISAKPLRSAHVSTGFADMIPGVDWETPGLREFFDRASNLERSNQFLFEWLRSCLDGYPLVPAVQLSPGTRLTTFEFTWDFRWVKQIRLQQNHLHPVPPGVIDVLWPSSTPSAKRPLTTDLNEIVAKLRTAIAETDEVAGCNAAYKRLTANDRESLTRGRSGLRADLAEETITVEAGTLAVNRHSYRLDREQHRISELTDGARAYCLAFSSVHNLIEQIADVFGQLVAHVRPGVVATVTEPRNLEFTPTEDTISVSWTDAGETGIINCGELRRLADPLVPDVLMITRVSYSFSDVDGNSCTYTGLCIPNSRAL